MSMGNLILSPLINAMETQCENFVNKLTANPSPWTNSPSNLPVFFSTAHELPVKVHGFCSCDEKTERGMWDAISVGHELSAPVEIVQFKDEHKTHDASGQIVRFSTFVKHVMSCAALSTRRTNAEQMFATVRPRRIMRLYIAP